MSVPTTGKGSPRDARGIRLAVALGLLMVVAGFTAIVIAWYNTGRTNQLWIQNQYIVSGGLGGLSLIIFGSVLLLRDAFLDGTATAAKRVLMTPSDKTPAPAVRSSPTPNGRAAKAPSPATEGGDDGVEHERPARSAAVSRRRR